MKPSVHLERACIENLELFERMERQLDTEEFVLPYSIVEHRRSFLDESTLYLRIMSRGRVAGFFVLVMEDDGRSVEFRRIVITPEERGIGQQAISLMESFCFEELSRQRIWLDVYATNSRGRHIYEKLGYQLFDKQTTDSGLLLVYEKLLA